MSTLSIDPATTAFVAIDLQQGTLALPLAPYPATQVVERAVQLASALRERGGLVIFVRVDIAQILRVPADAPTRSPDAPPPPPEASEITPAAGVRAGDIVITKRQWGAFYGTPLEQDLHRRGIRTIILGGVATNFGVESTARAAFDRGFHLLFAEDAMTSLNEEAHHFAIRQIFPRMGRVRSTQEIVDALGG